MPQYQMPGAHLPAFKALDEFTQGYITAACWLSCGPDDGEMDGKGFADLAPEAVAEMAEDCTLFQAQNANDLTFVCDGIMFEDYSLERAGTDFWLSRNGHGSGFWDRGLKVAGERLDQAAKGFGSCDLYLGDDGKVYVS